MATQLSLFDLDNFQVIPRGPGEWTVKAKPPQRREESLSISQAAKLLGVPVRTLQEAVQCGDITAYNATGRKPKNPQRRAGKWMVYRDSLMAWDARRKGMLAF